MRNTICLNLFLLGVVLASFCSVYSQPTQTAFEVSSKYRSLIIVSPKNCPIKLDSPKTLYFGNNGFRNIYSIFNDSGKMIAGFEIREVNWQGYQENVINFKFNDTDMFSPYERFLSFGKYDDYLILKLDQNTRRQMEQELEIKSSPKKVWITVITKVWSSDGVIYDNLKLYNEILKFIKELKVDNSLSYKELKSREKEIKSFAQKSE
jgi:hypothetical protein